MAFENTILVKPNVLEALNDLTSNLNANIQTDLLLLKFSKVFDTVSHKRLDQLRNF